MADSILPFEALFNEAAMSAAYAAKKCGFSRASGFEDFRDRFMEQSLAFSLHPFCTVTVVLNNGFDLTDSTELLNLFYTSESSNDTMGYDGRSY
jgi:hypothetical protein